MHCWTLLVYKTICFRVKISFFFVILLVRLFEEITSNLHKRCLFVNAFLQYGLPLPVALLRADNNLPPWRSGLKEVIFFDNGYFFLNTNDSIPPSCAFIWIQRGMLNFRQVFVIMSLCWSQTKYYIVARQYRCISWLFCYLKLKTKSIT